MNGSGNRPPRSDMGRRLTVTFAVAALLYLAPVPQSMARNILGLATSLVDRGSVGLEEFNGVDVAVREGRILSGMPPGASFVAAGIYLIGRPLFRLIPAHSTPTALYVLCTILVAIPAASLTVSLVYRTAIRWGASQRAAFLTAGLLAFGTMHFGYATGFYKKTLAAACVMGAFRLLAPTTGGGLRNSRAGLAGLLCGLAIGQDYPTAVIAVLLGGYLLSRRPGIGTIAAFAAGAGIAILPVLAYHQAAFGSPWVTAYHFRTDPASNTLREPRLGPFFFLLVTLLASSPCLLWSGLGWWRAVRTPERRAEMVTIAGIVLGTLLLFSGWTSFYPHEASFPSRLLLPIIPFAVLPMVFGVPAGLRGWPLLVIGWSVGATLLAAQASMIPSNTIPPVYALKVLGTSWGSGPLFGETLASWLGRPTLHLTISRGIATTDALLRPESRQLLLEALLGQVLIKCLSLAVTAIAGVLLWRLVWRPVAASAAAQNAADLPSESEGRR